MHIPRRNTRPNTDVFSTVEWTTRRSRITNADGSTVFEMNDAEVPASWSQLATDIMVSKYFRKAGVPVDGGPNGIAAPGTKARRHEGTEGEQTSRDREGAENRSNAQTDAPSPQPSPGGRGSTTGPEKSARQVIHRLAGCWRHWGETHGYFDTAEDAQAFYDELCHMMLHQQAAPNSPQWFNTGLHWAYGISGPAQGHWITDARSGETRLADDAYTHPQPHACFIQSVSDDLVNEGGIMDLWTREARLFKYGSGTGSNFSSLRGEGEPLSGGGKSSGLMSFLKIGDRAAGAIKSGGTTRRAAKMACLDVDHPDIESFVNWKVREELKVAALVEGMKNLTPEQKEIAERLGLELTYDFNGEAYQTVSGQNANNSVRLTDAFMQAVKDDADWELTNRTDECVARRVRARDLWEQICFAAWSCADPGLQYDTTINQWHTCPANGRINASNPCSEYMFLDDTACNLASINLMTFYDAERRRFDVEGFEHAVRIWTIVLEISVLMASFPSREIARQSYRFRTLGLGYANLGAMLMQAGIPYDSEDGRAICGAVTSILCGRSYATSAEMAQQLGAFPAYEENRESMLRVIRNHRRAAHGVGRDSHDYEQLSIPPVPIDHAMFEPGRINIANADVMLSHATKAWDDALALGEQFGYRNAQVTVIAPTGTIGLLMDCDTTGVEPDFALVKFKKLAGGGYFKIANASLRPALQALGYDPDEIDAIVQHVMGTLSLDTPMPEGARDEGDTLREFLLSKGYTGEQLVDVENMLPTVFELNFAFNAWSMPADVLRSCGIDPEAAKRNPRFNGLKAMGLNAKQIEQLNDLICGSQTVEGAPHLKDEHLAVFDCANRCGRNGRRFIATEGHIRMMAAAQPFISGAISKTINLPAEATTEDIGSAYWLSWELGLKANALYRDGSKLSQPLSTKSDSESDDDHGAEKVADALGESSTEAAAAVSATLTSSTSSDPNEAVLETVAHAAANEAEPQYIERVVEKIVERPLRQRLPETRRSVTHRFNVAGHEGYLTIGLYDDGSPGELFITMSKEGSTIGGLMDSLGTAISVALQYGVPLESLVKKFAHQRFEPMGMTTNRDIPFAKSLVDYIFRWLGMEFIPGYREENSPKRSTPNGHGGGAATPAPAMKPGARIDVKEDESWPGQPSAPPSPRGADAAKTGERYSSSTTEVRASHEVREQRADGSETTTADSVSMSTRSDSLSHATAALQTDAPACDECGSIMVRNGTCYRCLNCGSSAGCS